jgi:hypothetical protein
MARQEPCEWRDTVNILKRIAPVYSIIGALFFFYGYYVLMFRQNVFEAIMFIVAYLLFMYASVYMDDDWMLKKEE